jgi:hypothetical protein
VRLHRSPRVFISYSHHDQATCDSLADWLTRNGFEATFDRGIHAGSVLTRRIAQLIAQADYVFALGTSNSFESPWVREEVAFARLKSKPYFPIVLNSQPELAIPPWFTGHDSSVFHEVKYVVTSPAADWSDLGEVVQRIRGRMPLELRTIVFTAFALVFGLPIVLPLLVLPILGSASSEIRERQIQVEEINKRLDAATLGQERRLRLRSSGGSDATWFDADTGAIIARDVTEGTSVLERHFFQDGVEFAIDRISITKAPDGTSSLRKTRLISSSDGSTIEDVFDSVGSLISKRVRRSADSPWIEYAEVSKSIYPSAYRYLVPLLPGPILPGYR